MSNLLSNILMTSFVILFQSERFILNIPTSHLVGHFPDAGKWSTPSLFPQCYGNCVLGVFLHILVGSRSVSSPSYCKQNLSGGKNPEFRPRIQRSTKQRLHHPQGMGFQSTLKPPGTKPSRHLSQERILCRVKVDAPRALAKGSPTCFFSDDDHT